MHVVTITHALVRPRDVDIPTFDDEPKVSAKPPFQVRLNSLSQSGSLAAVIPIAFIATRIELAILVDVNRDVENIGIIVESLLHSVSCFILLSDYYFDENPYEGSPSIP